MIAQRTTSYNRMEINREGAMQAIFALFSQRQAISTPRWDCVVCGMIHMGAMPAECDSCGSHVLAQQSDIHCEMNNHW